MDIGTYAALIILTLGGGLLPPIFKGAFTMRHYELTGNTYDYRFEIKQLGFKWNSLRKAWQSISSQDLTEQLKALFNKGVTVKVDGQPMFQRELTARNDLGYKPGQQVEIKAWLAKQVAKQENLDLCFRNLMLTEVYSETAKAIQAKVKFVSKVANSCHLCGRELDTEISRATGIGPVCAKKLGLDRGTYEDAALALKYLDEYADKIGEIGPVWIAKSQIL